ncbi:MAG TPA: PAS domain-containing protein [Candidatus Ozemobacteraceae bacterium]|nr:PAS domain-containing protein [Candidatus Ozemobacteraceae bacterium]
MQGLHRTNQELLEENTLLMRKIQELEQSEATRKLAEEALRQSEARYRTLLENIPQKIFMKDLDSRYIFINANLAGDLGVRPEDVVGKTDEDLFSPELAAKYRADDLRIIRTGQSEELIEKYLLGGQETWIRTIKSAIRDANGLVTGVCGIFSDVTERKRAEEALRKSEERYRTLLSSLEAGVVVHAPDTSIIMSNPRASELLGLTDDQMRGKTALDPAWKFVNEAGLPLPLEEYPVNRISRTKQPIHNLLMGISKGGAQEIVWIALNGFPALDGAGEIVEIVTSFIDITERKQAEEALRASEAQKNAILNGITTNIALVDKGLKILWANKAAAESVNKRPEDMVGRPCYSIWGDSVRPCANCPSLKAIQTGKSEHIIVHSPNGKIWQEGGEPVFDTEGNVVGVVEIAQDITERMVAEAALAAEKERLAVTLRSIGDGVITTDTQGNVVIMNKVAEELTGWLQSEAQGRPLSTVFRIINEGTRQPCENPAERVLATGRIIELANHTLLIARDGTERVVADSGAPIMDQNGVTIGVVLVFRDMTEKQKLLDVLQRTDKLDSLGVLAGGIAHDFNNMLAGIFGYIDLAREMTADKTVALYLEKSMAAFSRAKDLTRQLLAFSKGGSPQRKTAELGPLIRESASFALAGSKIACDYDIDENLWLADFDKSQIGQVIDNIVINAQQAMPAGGRIVISAKNCVVKERENRLLKPGKFIRLSVADTGVGIPPEHLKCIFDPFFTTKQKGHGLGLATCYAIVQKHDGCIEVESVVGKGSTFHVFLPASQQNVVTEAVQTAVSHQGRGRILIMDDEPSIREILGRFLEGMGYTILEAKDGEEALQICAEAAKNGAPVDGAFFDLTVPGGMDTKEAIVRLRKAYPEMPVYASSGYSDDPVMAVPAEYGFTDSIRKPYRKEELVAMLNRHARKDPVQK